EEECDVGKDDLYLRFEPTLKQEDDIVEAYVLVCPVAASTTLTLHVADVTTSWTDRSTLQPARLTAHEVGLPRTHVGTAVGQCPIRMDIRELVQSWKKSSRTTRAVALRAEGSAGGGMRIALRPDGEGSVREPSLELYVR